MRLKFPSAFIFSFIIFVSIPVSLQAQSSSKEFWQRFYAGYDAQGVYWRERSDWQYGQANQGPIANLESDMDVYRQGGRLGFKISETSRLEFSGFYERGHNHSTANYSGLSTFTFRDVVNSDINGNLGDLSGIISESSVDSNYNHLLREYALVYKQDYNWASAKWTPRAGYKFRRLADTYHTRISVEGSFMENLIEHAYASYQGLELGMEVQKPLLWGWEGFADISCFASRVKSQLVVHGEVPPFTVVFDKDETSTDTAVNAKAELGVQRKFGVFLGRMSGFYEYGSFVPEVYNPIYPTDEAAKIKQDEAYNWGIKISVIADF